MSPGAALLAEYRASDGERLLAAMDDVIARVAEALAPACNSMGSWRGRVRMGLTALLELGEEDPDLAWAWAETLPAHPDPRVREKLRMFDEMLLGVLALAHADDEAQLPASPETGAWLLETIRSVVAERLEREERPRFTELVGPLTAMVALPFLGLSAVAEELAAPALPR
jgi:hypothetical protein